MKQLIFTLFFVATSVFGMQAKAQWCGVTSTCTPSGGPPSGGFDAPDSTPCVVQGTAYSHNIEFTMFSSFFFNGPQTVDSIEFISINNLPCGLCWSVNRADKRYAANVDGCLTISGATNDAPGQYKFALSLKAWINGSPGIVIPASTVDATGIRLYVRVKTNGGNCAGVDTATNGPNLTATLGCPTGISELSSGISTLDIIPNPMSSNGILTFTAEKSALYTLRFADITGKEVSVKQIEGKLGDNRTPIERNDLSPGVYIYSLSDGVSVATKRVVFTE